MTRKHLLSLGSAALVLVVCVYYILTTVLTSPFGASTITVDLPLAGGLYQGSDVTYRGIVVGKVTDFRLASRGVAATVSLQPGADIPRGAAARVRSLSPIGEQFLDFEPTTTSGPFLRSGDVVAASATDVPTTVADLATSMNTLMSEIDPVKVRTVLGELNTGLAGAEQDLQSLAVNGTSLASTLDSQAGVIVRLLSSGQAALQLGADSRSQIVALTRSYATFAEWLQSYQPQLYAMLDKAPGQIEEMRHLIRSLAADMPSFLEAQASVAGILNTRNAALRALLQYFPAGLEAFASTISGGRVQLDIVARKGLQCVYSTIERTPQDTTYRPLQEGGYCSSSLTTYSQRGAQFAPRPR